ncbi:MAG: redox-regulated ATPase YchF [Deltaproteobacteria bacterium]|nr:redox-regulated ATPase YchF [Deltaproteobacteria bacterium]
MKVGIIGRVSAGRNTLFDALTGQGGAPRTPGKARLGIARVADPRVDRLTELCKPKKTVYAEFTLALPQAHASGPVDAAGVRELRDLKAYAHVVGAYTGEPVAEFVPQEIQALSTELVLNDMERVEKRRARIAKGGGARPGEEDALAMAAKLLEQETPLRLHGWDEQALDLLDDTGLVSQRPVLTVVNVTEELLGDGPPAAVHEAARAVGSEVLWLCAPLELEIAALDAAAQQEFLAAYGLSAPVSQRFVQASLHLLKQICFFTVGPDEVRAWPIPRETKARRAARAIHSDLEKGFIRAEVIDYDVFLQHGSEAKCRAVGQLRVEGKDYEVKDGDIITIRFNV